MSRYIGYLAVALLLTVATVATAQDPPKVVISEIQGTGHISPFKREYVEFDGIVTVVVPASGFYVQSPEPDNNPATSEGVFVKPIRLPDVAVGDRVNIVGRVEEIYPSGASSGNLSVTTIRRTTITTVSRGNGLRAPTVIGPGGRVPPGEIITDDADGPIEESLFDPENDGIDFYESLEGMVVQVNDAISVGTVHTSYGEIWVVPDGGSKAGIRTDRGGIVVREGDFNPDRVLIDYEDPPAPFLQDGDPRVLVGDEFTAPIVGVLSYSYGNYKILPVGPLPSVRPQNLPREITSLQPDEDALRVGSFNVYNLSPRDPQAKFDDIAETIVVGMAAPDVVALSEVQDNDGTNRESDSSADLTAAQMIEAINRIDSNLDYAYVDIAPEYNKDGGAPHGNIRCGFLYRTQRVTLVTQSDLESGLAGNPQRVAPDNRAFSSSRKPLAAEFAFGGQHFVMIALHFKSKGGDNYYFGRMQPPTLTSERQRNDQAMAVAQFVADIREYSPEMPVIVAGDFNDFAFSNPLQILTEGNLSNLGAELLPEKDIYSYIYEGNSQALDHILASEELIAGAAVEYVHRYSEYLYGERWSDHDPVVALIRF